MIAGLRNIKIVHTNKPEHPSTHPDLLISTSRTAGEAHFGSEVIPARTHAVEVVIEAPQHSEVAIVALRIVVEARNPMTIADSMLCRPGPLDLHFEVDLDEDPPNVRTADGSDPDVRSLGTLPRGAKGLFTLVARTQSWDITWRLQVEWKCGQHSGVFTSPQLRTTGETGWRRFDPTGKAEPADPSLPEMTY
ncbi:hypothetical protein [Streptomyces sp. WZ-12]|uniref:hypothetical protein n=1 Tax=Streptomyces sp. WZ-12 TaxID=3030210 RepID=UPI0023811F51|nr:hypothetical protein [Streptomyces sp. WZ-12]